MKAIVFRGTRQQRHRERQHVADSPAGDHEAEPGVGGRHHHAAQGWPLPAQPGGDR